MIEEYEDITLKEGSEQTDELTRLSDSQQAYLKEVNVPSEDWAKMTDEQKSDHLDIVQARIEELKVDNLEKVSSTNLLSPEMIEDLKRRLEAPNDMVQIEQVSDVLANCEEIRFENWQHLERSEKVDVLNQLETKIASIEHRPPCPIKDVKLKPGLWGGYNPVTKTIDINRDYIDKSGKDYYFYSEIVDTLVHEGRHAYQDYNVNERIVHPRHSEVESWSDTMAGGKWGYWGDCSSELGQRLYEQQSVEIDARNFAADVISRMEDKIEDGSSHSMAKSISFEGSNDSRDIAKSELLSELSSNHIYPGTVYTDNLWGGLDSFSGNRVRDAINRARDNGSISDSTYKHLIDKLKQACHHQA